MSSDAHLIMDARQFLRALSANNTREWWQDNKGTYDAQLKKPALSLLYDLVTPLQDITGEQVTPKLFRPHRDVRFSKDKTPYNTHLHMMWQVNAGAPQNPVFFFGIGLDYLTIGAGIMDFDKPVLTNWRKMIDLDTDRIIQITEDVTAKGYRFREPALKRVPPPFDKAHLAGDLLRMKGCVASRELAKTSQLHNPLVTAFAELWPLNALLISIAAA